MADSGVILLTGAAGFTGRHLLNEAMNLGFKCIALCQDSSFVTHCDSLTVDIRDKAALSEALRDVKVDYVIHLAAISFIAHGDNREIYDTNLIGTINLLDVLIELKIPIKKVLLASSGNVYGNSDELPISESTGLKPANDYAVSKWAMEQAARIRMEQLPIIIARPFNYVGRGQAKHFLVPKLVHSFQQKQRVIELGNLDVSRDFSDVRDVVSCYLKLITSDVRSEVFNLCSGKAVSVEEIIALLSVISDHTIDITSNPAFVRDNEIQTLYGKNEKLTKIIGRFNHYSLDKTLEWMLATK